VERRLEDGSARFRKYDDAISRPFNIHLSNGERHVNLSGRQGYAEPDVGGKGPFSAFARSASILGSHHL
jgi:hypothetical protein